MTTVYFNDSKKAPLELPDDTFKQVTPSCLHIQFSEKEYMEIPLHNIEKIVTVID